jgi:hypothetical protein
MWCNKPGRIRVLHFPIENWLFTPVHDRIPNWTTTHHRHRRRFWKNQNRAEQYGTSKSSPSLFEEEAIRNPNPIITPSSSSNDGVDTSSTSDSLAAKAIRASSARRDSSLSSLYGHSNLSSPRSQPTPTAPPSSKVSLCFFFCCCFCLIMQIRVYWWLFCCRVWFFHLFLIYAAYEFWSILIVHWYVW